MKQQKPENLMRVNFPSRSVNEGLARSLVASFAALADPTVEELCDIKTAVSEAVTNCIVHGYKDSIGPIYLTVRLTEEGEVIIRIRDKGCGIADIPKAMEPLYTTCETGERAGLGFAVMQSFMDKVKVTSKGGVTVVMKKRLKLREGANG